MKLDPCPLPSSYTDNRHSSALPLSEAPKHPQIHPSLWREHRYGGGREWGPSSCLANSPEGHNVTR